MTASRIRPLFVVLLLLTFCCQNLAAAAMHCRNDQQLMPISVPIIKQAEHHDHHLHQVQLLQQEHVSDIAQHMSCCSTAGECLMVCSLALANAALPPAIKMSSPPFDDYLGMVPQDVVSSVYKPPISA